ncbi:hypothetical protein [Methylomonas sp. MgM2]
MTKPISWHRIALSRHEYESGELNVLLGAFRAAYVAKNGPAGMAMFGCWKDDETCYFVYITPKSVRYISPLLDAYSAKQIDTPDTSSLSLIYGDELSQSHLTVEFKA